MNTPIRKNTHQQCLKNSVVRLGFIFFIFGKTTFMIHFHVSYNEVASQYLCFKMIIPEIEQSTLRVV